MKVLFAVSNDKMSESIIKQYQKEYKQIISYKNVYYFNAILKELQRDKTYERIVISEDLEQYVSADYEQRDKFLFDKLDSISDEASNMNGEDIPIILICTERRTKSEPILVKLFGIGIYNAIIGIDRSVPEVCRLINRPRSKKEAKIYSIIINNSDEDRIYKDKLLDLERIQGAPSYILLLYILTEQKRLNISDEQILYLVKLLITFFVRRNITDIPNTRNLNKIFMDIIDRLTILTDARIKEIEDKGDESFIKNWLRAQYAETIRETKAGAVKEDFDLISVEFHKWVRDEKDKIGLVTSHDYEDFIGKFKKYADVYQRVRQLEKIFDKNLPYVYYNAQIGFTFQMQLILASICYEDAPQTINEKINLVSRFVDLLVFSRVTRYRSVDYSTIKQYVFRLSKSIRRANIETLKKVLLQEFHIFEYDYEETIGGFGLNNFTKRYIKHILARIISFIEEQMLVQSRYAEYMDSRTKNPFEIEHIITNHPEWFPEYTDRTDFDHYRNKIGALLLLHKSINASLSDRMYKDKLPKYCSNEGNILTESLGDIAYVNNPRFKSFVSENNLPFKPYSEFSKKEIDERTALIAELSKLVWNEKMFL